MQQVDLYSEFGCLLSSTEAAQAISALRQDALVWQSLENSQIWQAAVAAAGSLVRRWSPGLLALLALGCDQTVEELCALPMLALDPDLHERVLRAYQNAPPTGSTGPSLQDAALLALALRERRRLTGSWNGLLPEIQARAGQGNAFPQVWRSAIACLVGLVPDPEEMLRALLPRCGPHATFEWLTHAMLSQPATNQDHLTKFTHLLQGQPLVLQLGTLRSLTLRGRIELAETLAEALLVGHPAFAMLRTTVTLGELDMPGLAARALALQQMGTLYQLSGNRSQAQSMLKTVEQTLKHWMAGLYLQEMHLDLCSDMPVSAGLMDEEKLSAVVRDGRQLKSELGAVMTTKLCLGGLTEQLEAEHHDPFLQIKLAGRLLQEGDVAMAQDLARQGVSALIDTLARTAQPFTGDFVYAWQPLPLIQALMDLGLTHEALQLSLALHEVRPTDASLIQFISQMYETMGDLRQACLYAQAAVSLEPHLAIWRRRLGQLRVSLEDWQAAYNELEMVLALSNPPTLDDRLTYARVALQTRAYPQVAEACEVILSENPENGLAAGLMGQALIGLGEREEALVFLSRATLLAPDVLAPWLTLAELQQSNGDSLRALETLRAAVTAAPDEADGHFALSEVCLAEGLLSEALPHLKQAFLLRPGSDTIAFLYGKTLHKLGHSSEARAVLERTRSYWLRRPEMAYEFALTALEQHDAEGALPALEVALRAPQPPVEWRLLFARVLLNEVGPQSPDPDERADRSSHEARCRQAETALNHVLEAEPDNFEARFLLANLQLERNQLAEALAAFYELSESRATAFGDLHWRVQWGLGRAALRLGEIDTALAALKEASQSRPDYLDLQRSLAEASQQAHLAQEAQAAAEYALQLSPDSVENLIWFAEMMIALDEPARAADALECAIELDPRQANLRIQLAQLQLSAGNLIAAKTCLAALVGLQDISSADLRQAAHSHLRMEDPHTALDCLERALCIDSEAQVQPDLEALFETARLRAQLGHPETALELIQRALANPADSERVESLPVYKMQADLLARLGRPQAALVSLEKALLIVPVDAQVGSCLAEPLNQTLSQIHQAFTHLLIEAGNLSAALAHAGQALDLVPHNLPFRYHAGQLALVMLQMERAELLVNQGTLTSGSSPDELALQALWIEMALFNGKESEAHLQLTKALALAPGSARFQALQARLAAAEGNLQEAQRLFGGVMAQVGGSAQPSLWLAEAALSAQRWQEANRLFEEYLELHAAEAMAYLGLARVVVLSAERQRACELLHCRANTPGAAALNDDAYARLERALHGLAERSSTAEVRHWQVRGQAAFQPSMQAARGLIAYIQSADDAAALVSMLRQLNNPAAVLQTARRHPQDARVQFQLGLCALGETAQDAAAEEGLSVAASLVAAYPGQPLHHALLAFLARQAGGLDQALDAFENALQLWPDEAGWHEAAGDLALELGYKDSGLAHREQALALDPGNVRAALKLGQVCLAENKVARAVTVLEKASTMGQDQADVWLSLARAYLLAGRMPQALESAMQAAEIDHLSAQGFLLAGETALAMEQLDQALDLARSAVMREPENPAAYLFLCHVYDLDDQPREALAALEQAAPIVRQDYAVAFERARLIHALHGPQQALETLERLAQDHPEEPDLLAFLARTQADCGDIRLAERHAFKALRLNPNQPDLALMLGRLQRKTGQLDQAVHLLSEAVRMAPGQLDAYLELGSVYQDRREYDQALNIYQQAMRVAPRDYQAYFQSGIILRDNKDYAGSEQMLRQAAELAPDNPTIRRQLIAVITLNLVHNK